MSEPNPLISWLTSQGGSFHPDASFESTPYGSRVIATSEIPSESTIVSCPFSLAISGDVAKGALGEYDTNGWNDRQLISTYLVLHLLNKLNTHKAYVDSLPKPEQLRTPLHFTPDELAEFKGTNMYGATLDREREWKAEWQVCNKALGLEEYTWERYLTAATYLSSRAFPSTVLSETPTLQHSPDTRPVLIPGVDALNHARAHPVTWHATASMLSLIQRVDTAKGSELLNNYGPKPNAELVLGYGFSIADNPEDTIVLKLSESQIRHEIGRGPGGYEGLWTDVLGLVEPEEEEDVDETSGKYEDELEAAQILAEMVQSLLDRLPDEKGGAARLKMRPEVATMLHDYVQGQRRILSDLLAFGVEKEREAVDRAKEQGIDLVFDD